MKSNDRVWYVFRRSDISALSRGLMLLLSAVLGIVALLCFGGAFAALLFSAYHGFGSYYRWVLNFAICGVQSGALSYLCFMVTRPDSGQWFVEVLSPRKDQDRRI